MAWFVFFSWLGVIALGLLVMTQIVSLEELGKRIWQVFLYLVIVIAVVWFFRSLLLPILICGLIWLKQALLRVLIVLLLAIGCAALLRALFVRVANQNSFRTKHKEKL